MKWEEKRDKKK